jgi:tRNA modification GTPase
VGGGAVTDPTGTAAVPGAGDTIVALATPPGRSAISVVRLSGPAAAEIGSRLLDRWPLAPRVAIRCAARDPRDGSLIDQVVATWFAAPKSYTGEHVLELSCHGGHAVAPAVLSALIASGARQALAGEFTRRAVLNGKIDLVQAEAVGDLIDARSDAMRRAALLQLDGGLSARIAQLRDELLDVEALLAYDIDFPEEDDGPVPRSRITDAAARALASLDRLLATAPAGALVRDGAIVVIAGAPNAGKSSLFNALLGESRAIVTEVPGTTRDAIEAAVEHRGWPLRLVDTAGLRTATELVERLGIEVSERYLARAAVVVACGEDEESLEEAGGRVTSLTSAPVLRVLTKGDLGRGAPADAIVASALDGRGLHTLLDAIVGLLDERYGAPMVEYPRLTRERHRQAIESARHELATFCAEWGQTGLPAPVAASHVRAAVWALDELIGAIDVEDVLERVFSSFCVGK